MKDYVQLHHHTATVYVQMRVYVQDVTNVYKIKYKSVVRTVHV